MPSKIDASHASSLIAARRRNNCLVFVDCLGFFDFVVTVLTVRVTEPSGCIVVISIRVTFSMCFTFRSMVAQGQIFELALLALVKLRLSHREAH